MSLASSSRAPWIGHSATDLARLVAAGEASAVEVVEAHAARIREVDARLRAVVVPMFESARKEAAAVDVAVQRGEPLGPLAGVPITVKECFHVAGTPSTIGISRFSGVRNVADGPLVTRLRRAGAIVLGKTNVPQLMLLHESENPVYGRTTNPWNAARSPGGSSGGEAAILAAGGSALGLATDLGGSIRQPAHACGIHGLKPTSGRLSTIGIRTNFNGQEGILMQPGPMARSVADLALAMRVLAAPGLEDLDPRVPGVPWRDPAGVSITGLKVAVWEDDGFFSPCPAARRVVREAAEALRLLGARVEPFVPPEIAEAMRLYFGLISADGGADVLRLLGDSPVHWQVRRLLMLGRIPQSVRPSLMWTLKRFGQARMARMVESTGPSSADQVWQMTDRMRHYLDRFSAVLDHGKFDAMLCPPHALPAFLHGTFCHVPQASSYCMLPNLLGVPAGVVAASRVRPGEESDRRPGRDRVEQWAAKIESGSAGLPIGVQVAARWWREDIVLSIMAALEHHFRRQPDYPELSYDQAV